MPSTFAASAVLVIATFVVLFVLSPNAGVVLVVEASEVVGGDPPPSFLPVDLSGHWETFQYENCVGFNMGMFIVLGKYPNFESIVTDRAAQKEIRFNCRAGAGLYKETYIFQDCLEITFTDTYHVHHAISDGHYVMDDFNLGTRANLQIAIEPPLPEESLDGAEAVVVIYLLNIGTGERLNQQQGHIRRYINADGHMVETKDMMLLLPTTNETSTQPFSTKGRWVHQKISEMQGCSGYDPDVCSGRDYTDVPSNWTVACCENQGGDDIIDSILVQPRPDIYNGERAKGNVDCNV